MPGIGFYPGHPFRVVGGFIENGPFLVVPENDGVGELKGQSGCIGLN